MKYFISLIIIPMAALGNMTHGQQTDSLRIVHVDNLRLEKILIDFIEEQTKGGCVSKETYFALELDYRFEDSIYFAITNMGPFYERSFKKDNYAFKLRDHWFVIWPNRENLPRCWFYGTGYFATPNMIQRDTNALPKEDDSSIWYDLFSNNNFYIYDKIECE